MEFFVFSTSITPSLPCHGTSNAPRRSLCHSPFAHFSFQSFPHICRRHTSSASASQFSHTFAHAFSARDFEMGLKRGNSSRSSFASSRSFAGGSNSGFTCVHSDTSLRVGSLSALSVSSTVARPRVSSSGIVIVS